MNGFLLFRNLGKPSPDYFKCLDKKFKVLFSNETVHLFSDYVDDYNYLHFQNSETVLFIVGNVIPFKNLTVNLDALYRNKQISHKLLLHFFKELNGIYCCILIDKINGDVYLISDPLGFYPVFSYEEDHFQIFSSEIKLMIGLIPKKLQLNELAFEFYLQNGHMLLDQSWYHEIKRIRPASIYHLGQISPRPDATYYWLWEDITKRYLAKEELMEIYEDRFVQGIHNLDFSDNTNLGLSLSGGLDSRWIAQIVSKRRPLEAFTFASVGSRELDLAKKVSTVLNIKHRVFTIPKSDWLIQRLENFWKMDGLLHLGHLHEGKIHRELRQNYSHYFHGFFGGGIYATKSECNKRINPDIANKYFRSLKNFSVTEDPFYNGTTIDAFWIDQKMRQQAAHSIYLLTSYCRVALPFYNLDWLEWNYCIDDRMQLYSKFYLEVLRKSMRKELLDIPWQRTGIAANKIALNVLLSKFKVPAIAEQLRQTCNQSSHFINYNFFDKELNGWINEFKEEIKNLHMDYNLNSRERKFRMLSLVIIIKMLSKGDWNVL